MARPKTVHFDKFHLYDKLHTVTSTCEDGLKRTILYPIRDTGKTYLSVQSWAYCASTFRSKRDIELKFELPELTDEKAINFLEEYAWHDWVDEDSNNSDIKESLLLIKKIFPNKEVVFFYELESLIGKYLWGSFNSDKERDLDTQKYYNSKYSQLVSPELEKMYEDNIDLKGSEREVFLKEYFKLRRNYQFENDNKIDIFIEICKNAVCYPVAFSRGTADWHKEEYGKICSYAHAGEIFFVTTKDKVYFEYKRHY